MLNAEKFLVNKYIEIVDASILREGSKLWEDGDIVQIKDVVFRENRMEVWNKDKSLSGFIYGGELDGIELYRSSKE